MSTKLTSASRIYTTVSLAILPAAVIVFLVFVSGFEEHGSQSQGLGALLVIAAIILGCLFINAIVAGALSYFVIASRPKIKIILLSFIFITSVATLFYIIMRLL